MVLVTKTIEKPFLAMVFGPKFIGKPLLPMVLETNNHRKIIDIIGDFPSIHSMAMVGLEKNIGKTINANG